MGPRVLIAMVGSFGSGCSYIADKILVAKYDYTKVSLSQLLKDRYGAHFGHEPNGRKALQEFGTELRRTEGPAVLALQACQSISTGNSENVVVDSIRNPAELNQIKNSFPNVLTIGVFASANVRWERVLGSYAHREDFDEDDRTDKDEGVEYGQRVTACFLQADVVIRNESPIPNEHAKSWTHIYDQISRALRLLSNPGCEPPSDDEALMASAYANGQRSSCLKRRVGSVVVDGTGHIISSGYNEVPRKTAPCLEEHGRCYRDFLKEEISQRIRSLGVENSRAEALEKELWGRFKVLDRCRSLHAEERAILNIARFGSHIPPDACMYVTTYPCNMCANKIVEVGIKRIVYFEPYPVKESVAILGRGGVNQEPFYGVTFNGYFRLFGGMPNANVS